MTGDVVRFDDFTLDVARRELRRGGTLVHLEPLAFDLLAFLVGQRHRVVPKVELLDGVWGHRFTSEANLTTRVKEIRRAVGDDGRAQHTIRNIRGVGYRFVAEVHGDVLDGGSGPPAVAVPAPPTLLGRDGALAAVADLVGRSPVTTILGPGGVGKSTLARAVRASLESSRGDGSPTVDLTTAEPGTPVLPLVASAARLVVEEDRDDDAVAALARRDALVLLDGCEHVADEVAHLVEAVLAVPDRRATVLATSQVRLGISGETVFTLDPLEEAAAVALFHERARAAVLGWDESSVDADRLRRLVARLDRLPLTIEMAAARLASLSFGELEHAINELTPLLHLTHRARVPRHRSLPEIVDWSAGLLDARRRRVFEEFAVFAGEVSAADAAAVLAHGDPAATLFDLASLAERSLLVAERGPERTTYRMLATVRTVAAQRLETSGAGERLRARHAEHVRGVLHEIDVGVRTPDEAAARARLDAIVAEARAAHRWAREHDPAVADDMSGALFYPGYSGLWSEPVDWSRPLCARPADAAAHPGAALVVAGAAAHRGQLAVARELAGAVAEVADGRVRVGAAELLADIGLYEGDLDAVVSWSTELHRLAEELDDRHALAFAVVDTALALLYGGEPHRALEHMAANPLDGLAPTDAAWVAYARGDALSLAGEPGAAGAFQEAITLGERVGNRYVASVAYTSLAAELTRRGDTDAALDTYATALRAALRDGNHTHALTGMRNLVRLLADLGDDRGVALLAGATSADHVRGTFGVEAELLADATTTAATRVGAERFDAWFAEGRRLDLGRAVALAADLVDDHRRSSDDPQTASKQPTP